MENQDNNQLSQTQINDIYVKLSVSTKEDEFDFNEELNSIERAIQELFDNNFLKIPTEILQKDVILINNKFVELLKYMVSKYNYKNIGFIFVGFCDYFDLNLFNTFKILHNKLQHLIENSAKINCGLNMYNEFKNKNKEHPELNIPTIFDITK